MDRIWVEGLGSSQSLKSSDDSLSITLGVNMEVITKCRKDPPKEHAESSLPKSVGYEWDHEGVQVVSFKFRWSRLLTS